MGGGYYFCWIELPNPSWETRRPCIAPHCRHGCRYLLLDRFFCSAGSWGLGAEFKSIAEVKRVFQAVAV
eukprot:9111995-Karenia_brevis.AAC.1